MYISALDKNAKSMHSVKFEVAMIITFVFFLSWSSCVSNALTTRIASDGSDPFIDDCLAVAND